MIVCSYSLVRPRNVMPTPIRDLFTTCSGEIVPLTAPPKSLDLKLTYTHCLSMSFRYILSNAFIVHPKTLLNITPQTLPLPNTYLSWQRPFIEFTKGGIRVNFAGYHAQAGLGGLLTGRASDGGLHASAGTPTGPNAAAGLGGTLDGGPGENDFIHFMRLWSMQKEVNYLQLWLIELVTIDMYFLVV